MKNKSYNNHLFARLYLALAEPVPEYKTVQDGDRDRTYVEVGSALKVFMGNNVRGQGLSPSAIVEFATTTCFTVEENAAVPVEQAGVYFSNNEFYVTEFVLLRWVLSTVSHSDPKLNLLLTLALQHGGAE